MSKEAATRRISGRLLLLPAPPPPNIERKLLRDLFMAVYGVFGEQRYAWMSPEISAMLLELRRAAQDASADHKAALAQAVEDTGALQHIGADPAVAAVLRQARQTLAASHDTQRLSVAMLPRHAS